MKPNLANDNGTPEDRLAKVTVALHRAVAGLDAPVKLVADAVAVCRRYPTLDKCNFISGMPSPYIPSSTDRSSRTASDLQE
jgi:hypothetical protein